MTKPDLLIFRPMMPMVMEALPQHFEVHRLWEAKDPEAELNRIAPSIRAVAMGGATHLDGPMMDRLPNLAIIGNFGVGYDSVDAIAAAKRGIVVTNTPDVLTEEVADTTIGLILATLRQYGAAERYLRAGKWVEKAFPLTPLTLRGRKAGIIGLGRIGKAVATRLDAFGVPVAYFGRSKQDVPYRYFADLKAMATAVDLLICIAPGGEATRHMIDANILQALGPDGVFINIGRGTSVDEAALIRALQDKTIASCGLDVFEDEPRVPEALIAMDHITLWPHIGSASVHTRNGMGKLVVDNLVNWAEGKPPLTPVQETRFAAKSR